MWFKKFFKKDKLRKKRIEDIITLKNAAEIGEAKPAKFLEDLKRFCKDLENIERKTKDIEKYKESVANHRKRMKENHNDAYLYYAYKHTFQKAKGTLAAKKKELSLAESKFDNEISKFLKEDEIKKILLKKTSTDKGPSPSM